MRQALVQLLPIAVAFALSSVPITVTLAVLSSKSSRSSLPFLAGWIIGITCVTTFFVIVAQSVPASVVRQPRTLTAVLELVIGAALMALAVVGHARRSPTAVPPVDTDDSESSTWLNRAGSFGPVAAFAVGLVLNVRPKALLLGAAAGLALNGPRLQTAELVVLVVVYVALASSTVVVPILGTLLAPRLFEPRIAASKAWIIRNGDIVMTVTLFVVGVFIAVHGLTRL